MLEKTDPGEAVESFFWWFRRGNIGWFMLVPFLVKKDVGFPEGIEDIYQPPANAAGLCWA